MRILLAEDEASLNRAVKILLERSGLEVESVFDGEQALESLLSGRFDGAVLDVMMPGKTGLEVLEALRRQGNTLPVLLLTAKAEVEDRVAGLEMGANDYLPKPFDGRELVARIRAMARTGKGWDTCLRLGNLRLDTESQQLSTPHGSLLLAKKELEFMEMLLLSPQRELPLERILEKLWAGDGEADAALVRVYGSYLDKKIRSLQGDCVLTYIEGKGYCLAKV